MNQIKGLDFSTKPQKTLAAVMGIGFLVFLYFFIWPLVHMLLGLYAFVALVLFLGMVGYNWETFFNFFKAISMRMSNKFIGYTKIEQHEIFYRHSAEEYQGISEAVTNFGAVVVEDERRIKVKEKSKTDNDNQALRLEGMGKNNEALEFSDAARIDTQVLEGLRPRYEANKAVYAEMQELQNDKARRLKTLRRQIDAEVEEYDSWKRNNKVTKAMSAFMNEDSPEARRFKEACKQTELEITKYISEYNSFSSKAQPVIAAAKANKEISLEESRLYLENLKQQKLLANAS